MRPYFLKVHITSPANKRHYYHKSMTVSGVSVMFPGKTSKGIALRWSHICLGCTAILLLVICIAVDENQTSFLAPALAVGRRPNPPQKTRTTETGGSFPFDRGNLLESSTRDLPVSTSAPKYDKVEDGTAKQPDTSKTTPTPAASPPNGASQAPSPMADSSRNFTQSSAPKDKVSAAKGSSQNVTSSLKSLVTPTQPVTTSTPRPRIVFNLSEVHNHSMDVFNQTNGMNIFFIESNSNLEEFHPRLLCAFESAAVHNPNYTVFVILSRNSSLKGVPTFMTSLQTLKFVRVDFDQLFNGTALEALWMNGSIQKKGFTLNNISNTLRLILVYRFGGVYFDSDIIQIGRIPADPANFIIENERDRVNNAVLKFEKGHPFLDLALSTMAKDFKGSVFGYQGPILLTRLVKSNCSAPNVTSDTKFSATQRTCPGFSVLPITSAYALPYGGWFQLFKPKWIKHMAKTFAKSFAVHYWNFMHKQAKRKYLVQEDQPIYKLFKENCPVTESQGLRHVIGESYLSFK